MTLSDLPHFTANRSARSPIRTGAILVVLSDASQRSELVEAIRAGGVPVMGVGSVADIEHWPRGQVVITDTDHVMPLWLDVGALEVIVLARNVAEWNAALARGATGWLQLPISAVALAALAVDASAFVAGVA